MPPSRRSRARSPQAATAVWALAALEALLEHLDGAALVVDGTGTILHANEAALRLQREDPRGLAAALRDARDGDERRFRARALDGEVFVVFERTEGPSRESRATTFAMRHSLSQRQREVLTALLDGKSNKEIASSLGIALTTVETHVSQILKRAGCSSRAELASKVWT